VFRMERMNFLPRISLHALVLCGLLTVILTGEIPWPIWLLALVAHPLSIVITPKKEGYFFNLIVILSFCYSLFLYFLLNTPFLIAFTQLLILVQTVKLFHIDKAKDHFQLAGLSLLTLLAAAGLTSQFYYLFLFFPFLVLSIWVLFQLHLQSNLERYPQLSKSRRPITTISFSAFPWISAVALCSFVITILIFFILPRLSLSVTGQKRWRNSYTGFSEIVDLRHSAPLQLNDRVVMRVELPQFSQPPSFPLYWRGMTFSLWNGHAWSKGSPYKKIGKKGLRKWLFLHPGRTKRDGIYQRIMIEPMNTDVLFCLHPSLEIRGHFSYLNIDEGGGIHLPSPPLGRYHYEVYSALKRGDKGDPEVSGKKDDLFLQLPEGSEYIVSLAHDIAKGEKTHLQKIHRVNSYLQKNYKYSLNPKRNDTFSPLEDFLLHSREGYCEHFATAAALLLRGLGIPTRLVCGFVQGEWNSLGKYYMVRQRDAHAWMEAYLPGSGWLSFDPTPAGNWNTPPLFIVTLNKYLDFLRLKWHRYIIQYSRDDQIRILFAFYKEVRTLNFFQETFFLQSTRDKKPFSQPSYLLVIGVASLLVILLVFRVFKKRRKVKGSTLISKSLPETSFYLKVLKALSKKKIPKRTSETPAEYAQRVGKQWNILYPMLERITNLYYKVRFGEIPLTNQEKEEISGIIASIQERLRHLSPSRERVLGET